MKRIKPEDNWIVPGKDIYADWLLAAVRSAENEKNNKEKNDMTDPLNYKYTDLELLNRYEELGSAALAQELNVSQRSIQRKIKALRESGKYELLDVRGKQFWDDKIDLVAIQQKGYVTTKEISQEQYENRIQSSPRISALIDNEDELKCNCLSPSEAVQADDGPTPESPEIVALRADLGLSQEDYDLASVKAKSWDTYKGKMHSIDATFRTNKGVGLLLPAERTPLDPNLKHSTKRLENNSEDKQLWIVLGDEQAPFNNKKMEAAVLRMLANVKFTHGIMVGDQVDFPTISKYPDNPEWDGKATPQECIDCAFEIDKNRVEVNPDISWSFLEGNHDARLRLEILRRAERIYGLRPGMAKGEKALEPILTLRNLLRLDELGIEYVKPKGNYNHAAKFITDDLCVIHGDKTGPNAIKNLMDEVDYSIIMGHNHKAIRMTKTRKTQSGHKIQHGVGLGTLAEIEGGTGYTPRPNWQNHFVTVTVLPDKSFHIEDAWFDGEHIVWRGEKY